MEMETLWWLSKGRFCGVRERNTMKPSSKSAWLICAVYDYQKSEAILCSDSSISSAPEAAPTGAV